MKKVNYRHFICLLIAVLSIALAFLIYRDSLARAFESVCDLFISLAFYVCEIYALATYTVNPIQPTVTELSIVFQENLSSLPQRFDDFVLKMRVWFELIISKENLMNYLNSMSEFLYNSSIVLLAALPLLFSTFLTARVLLLSENNRIGKETLPLRIWKKTSKIFYVPVKNFVLSLFEFIKQNSEKHSRLSYKNLFILIWLINLNLMTIIVEFFAYLFYFMASFESLANVYIQVFKLSCDLVIVFKCLPVVVWLLIALIIIDSWRKRIGLSVLRYNERKNQQFVKGLPLIVLIVGAVGSKKTTTMTDLLLSLEVVFRRNAFDIMRKADYKFANFPWSVFERQLQNARKERFVYSLASCKKWVREHEDKFLESPSRANCFGYDYKTYGLIYTGELMQETLFDVLETYAKAYFIYTSEQLIVSNFSVRTDGILNSCGNFPLWDLDFFNRESSEQSDLSRYSKILDFDVLRFGKLVKKNNTKAGSFEFGIVGVTEEGKERLNQVELQGKKKTDDEANQRNDNYSYSKKMGRHPSTVDNIPFYRFISDEQRLSSLPADLVQISTILRIKKCGEKKLAMPAFFIEELLQSFLSKKFGDLYTRFRFLRGDNTLFMYLFKKIVVKFNNYYCRIYDKFSYSVSKLETEAGTLDGNKNSFNYYLSSKKIYSDRFTTDCYSAFFEAQSLKSCMGLDDYESYSDTRATVEELESQNSYFIHDLKSIGKDTVCNSNLISDVVKSELQTELEKSLSNINSDLINKVVENHVKKCLRDSLDSFTNDDE